MKVTVEIKDGKLTTEGPFNAQFPTAAKNLGGRWDPINKVWVFDPRDEERVRALCKKVYGTDGSIKELKSVRVRTLSERRGYCEAVYCGPIQIARAFDRDSGAKLTSGVILLNGTIDSGGSRANWETRVSEGSEFELRDLPADTAKMLVTNPPTGWEVKEET